MTGSGFSRHWHRAALPLAAVPDRGRQRWERSRVVSVSCAVATALCGLFAAVLVAWIAMVLGGANPAGWVAGFVRDFAAAVSLGFDDLFTPANPKVRVLLNDGLAAVAWLGIRALATLLIRRFALPRPRRLPD
ncbi:hypothetical protein [Amycolatopsis sp. NPDC054798]